MVIPKSTLRAGLRLYHQRQNLFVNDGDYPYHPFVNCFYREDVYLQSFPRNTWCYEVIQDIPDMIQLTTDFYWDDLLDHLENKRGWDMVLAATAIAELKVPGVFYDFPARPGIVASDTYFFSLEVVQKCLRLVSKDIQAHNRPEEEISGYWCPPE